MNNALAMAQIAALQGLVAVLQTQVDGLKKRVEQLEQAAKSTGLAMAPWEGVLFP